VAITRGALIGAIAPVAEPSRPALDDLERLAALHASGALTDEEFAAKKRQLLDL
jgi:hypothetical protein